MVTAKDWLRNNLCLWSCSRGNSFNIFAYFSTLTKDKVPTYKTVINNFTVVKGKEQVDKRHVPRCGRRKERKKMRGCSIC